jgi:DNA invertase Pin-like site-specific DNA recombinase
MAKGFFVIYYRVSAAKQGRSGLGLDAQRAPVATYVNGGRWKLCGEFVEVESGKRADRPELAKAIAACRLYGAKLLVAKLDRLSRDPGFLRDLERSGIDFVAADMPDANRLTVGIMALVAEQEREAISARTRVALAAAKERGTKLGGFRGYTLTEADHAAAKAGREARSQAQADRIRPTVVELRAAGITSANGIAKALNERDIPTAKGGQWQAVQVQRVLARLPTQPR